MRLFSSEFLLVCSCLREILQNILEQVHFTDEDKTHSYAMYDPSMTHDESSAHEYGGYKSNDICEVASNDDLVASTEDLSETKQRSSHYNSTSSLTKLRQNSNDTPLNFDDTEPESDDDDEEDGFKRVKSSDDKRIFVKELNYVKGRQVGLLIGPFGKSNDENRSSSFHLSL